MLVVPFLDGVSPYILHRPGVLFRFVHYGTLPPPTPHTHSAVRILLDWFLVRHFFTDGDQMSVAKGSLYSEVSCLGGVAGLGVPVRSGPMYRRRGGGPCIARSNASWIVVTWDPYLWAEWLTDSHVWKHYRPAILLAAGNNIHLCKSFQCGIPFQRGATSSREEFQWHCNYISISTSSHQPKENQNHFCIALITHTYFRSQVKVWWLGIFRWSTCVILCGPHWHNSTKTTL